MHVPKLSVLKIFFNLSSSCSLNSTFKKAAICSFFSSVRCRTRRTTNIEKSQREMMANELGATSSNIEIKAKVHDLDLILQKAKSITDQPEELLIQTDTYFKVPSGRLKLREIKNEGSQLVFYERPDTEGPKLSRYKKQDFKDAKEVEGMKAILQASLGTIGIVNKQRHLFMKGQTRIHIDEVETLGSFMELEVVLHEGQNEVEGQTIANELMSSLNISSNDLLPCSYIDLLLERKKDIHK